MLAKWHRNLALKAEPRVSKLCLGTNSSVVDGQPKDFRARLLMSYCFAGCFANLIFSNGL